MRSKTKAILIFMILTICLIIYAYRQVDEKPIKGLSEVVIASDSIFVEMSVIEKALMILQAELDEEVKTKRLLRYNGLWAAPLVMGNSDEIRAVVGYTVDFGNQKGTSGVSTDVKCILTMKKELNGAYSEIRENRKYEVVGDSSFKNFSWIIDHPYVAWIAKKDLCEEDRDDIALILFQQWLDTLKDWDSSERTFVITKYKEPEVKFWISSDTKAWGTQEGKTGSRPKHPGSLGSWIYNCQCRYQFLGYTSNVSLTTDGLVKS